MPRALVLAAAMVLAGGGMLGIPASVGCSVPPDWGAAALVRPGRRPVTLRPAHLGPRASALEVEVEPGLVVRGLVARADRARRRGLVLYLHGVGDNHAQVAWLARRLVPLGFDVASYSARGHGSSEGELCTYGFHEKRDVARVLDALLRGRPAAEQGPVVLLGHSMGAAVALQAAPLDPRVSAVIAVAPFADLPSAIADYTPFYLRGGAVRSAVERAEALASFRVDEVSPLRAVARLKVPLLLVHGTRDRHLPPRHSRQLLAAASPAARARLALIEGADHSGVLAHAEGWRTIVAELDRLAPPR